MMFGAVLMAPFAQAILGATFPFTSTEPFRIFSNPPEFQAILEENPPEFIWMLSAISTDPDAPTRWPLITL